jgi:hypothetical protein
MRYKYSEAKLRVTIHRESNYLSVLACGFQNMADIHILKSSTNGAYPTCQASLKYSKLSSKFINWGVGERGQARRKSYLRILPG